MSGSVFKRWLCGGVFLGALAAQAADFSVGRVDITFAEEHWKEVPLPDATEAYGGDRAGALAVQSKLYVRAGSDSDVQALALVSANSHGLGGGRGGYMTYTPDCKSDAQIFREGNSGFKASFLDCLTVTPLYSSASVFKALAPELLALQGSGIVSVKGPLYTVWSRYAISTGSFLDVRVFVMSPVTSDNAPALENAPSGIRPDHVAWGRRLRDAVKSSVHSLSGRLEVPPLRLVPTTPSAPSAAGPQG